MTTVIGVSFKRAGKMYYFDPGDLELHAGDQVVVETARGMECGDVVTERREVADEEVVQPLKPVLRVMTEDDHKRVAQNSRREMEAFKVGQQRIVHHKLEMKLVDVEYTFDLNKIIFYFTANGRIDFRELVKDLASIFKTRIELRQIGVRDEAKMLGGLGSCGRPICCRTFLGDFQPVSIKMAKEQNLLLNPTKISGLCGRLMCCLKYEQETYEEAYRRAPRVGKEVLTPDGRGVLTEVSVVREKARVRFIGKDGAPEMRDYEFEQVQLAPKEPAPQEGGEAAPQQAPAPAQPEQARPAKPPRPPRRKAQPAAEGVQEGAAGGEAPARPPRPPRPEPPERGRREPSQRGRGEPPPPAPRAEPRRERQRRRAYAAQGPAAQGRVSFGRPGEKCLHNSRKLCLRLAPWNDRINP